ncbi:MAG: hypothetical protein QOF65_2046 [Thermoleophilaceae bacterium]|jgi:hypothetical protein|nr:hypothetical protein [Thermoleophilaceae bacterium]
MMVAASNPPLFLGIMGVVVLVLGFAAVIALAVYVIKRAPKDGSDIGRDPHLDGDERGRRNGHGTAPGADEPVPARRRGH